MSESNKGKCPSCGQKAHDFKKEEVFDCIPPKDVLQFGDFIIDKKYRKALYEKFPFYNTEEVVGSFFYRLVSSPNETRLWETLTNNHEHYKIPPMALYMREKYKNSNASLSVGVPQLSL